MALWIGRLAVCPRMRHDPLPVRRATPVPIEPNEQSL
jgi:hypothetical protein